jgi:hypothetical protein
LKYILGNNWEYVHKNEFIYVKLCIFYLKDYLESTHAHNKHNIKFKKPKKVHVLGINCHLCSKHLILYNLGNYEMGCYNI